MKKQVGVTLKSFITGTILTIILSIMDPYIVLVNNTQGFTFDFIAAGALVIFFIFVGLINVLTGLINKKYALSGPELIVVYIMLVIASAIPTKGLVGHLISILSSSYYFATPANQWAEKIVSHIPSWLAPTNPEVHKYLYEGLSKGMKIPWGVWIIPMLSWILLMIVIYSVSLGILVVLRKQWIVNERLIFPLTVIPLEIIREEERAENSLIKPFYKNKLMWLGFIIAFLFMSWNALSRILYFIPPINLGRWYLIFRNTTAIGLSFSFVVIGFTYFINLDVAFSFWFFYLLSKVFIGLCSITGFGLKGQMAPFEEGQLPSVTQLCMGALIMLVLYGAWTGRKHIKNVLKKALTNDNSIDDSDEIMSYRTALIVIFIGIIFITVWMKLTGLSLIISPYFIFILFIIFIAMSRIMAEGGFGFGKPPSMPMSYLTHTVPTSMLDNSGLTSLALTTPYAGDIRTTFMTSAIHGLKIVERGSLAVKPIALVMIAAAVISMVTSIITTIHIAYTYGGASLENSGWLFNGYPQLIWSYVSVKVDNPTGIFHVLERWLWAGIGALIMFFLMFMHHRFIWWPIHYIGFPIVGSYLFNHAWLCIFIGWFIKAIILKYGGIKIYQKLKPFFLGLILGQLCCAFFWSIIFYFANIRTGTNIWVGLP